MTLTKERIIEELKASTQNASGMFEINEDTICALMELLESRADAEPVAYRDRKECNGIRFADGFDYGKLADGAPLYTAPPAPVVVPDEIDINDPALDTHRKWMAEGWNRCRAAMLQGKDEPVQGWIPCNERLPEADGNYWGWWNESKRQGPVWFIKSDLQAQFQSSEITHWMPLPAAPKQEANNG
ncbi:DUF551 domain-containing protein [Atlantibacter hermannii]|uniref:DUF551 domain-containing protein n=1 Tax=Atlantibacter hermannii TaxID=565 RepID=UPI0028A93E68|nr:DUF551 domain-containing protein [Atlantibacter hermannii]